MMKKHIYDESNGLSYILHGDYYLPDLVWTALWNTREKFVDKQLKFFSDFPLVDTS